MVDKVPRTTSEEIQTEVQGEGQSLVKEKHVLTVKHGDDLVIF